MSEVRRILKRIKTDLYDLVAAFGLVSKRTPYPSFIHEYDSQHPSHLCKCEGPCTHDCEWRKARCGSCEGTGYCIVCQGDGVSPYYELVKHRERLKAMHTFLKTLPEEHQVTCMICNGNPGNHCGCNGVMTAAEAIDYVECELDILSK